MPCCTSSTCGSSRLCSRRLGFGGRTLCRQDCLIVLHVLVVLLASALVVAPLCRQECLVVLHVLVVLLSSAFVVAPLCRQECRVLLRVLGVLLSSALGQGTRALGAMPCATNPAVATCQTLGMIHSPEGEAKL